VKGKWDIVDIIEKKKDYNGMATSKGCWRRENTKINYGTDPTGEKEERISKENLDRGSTCSHDNKKFETRPMAEQRGMALGFQKVAGELL
jgi:hypothetical protein